MSATVQRLIAEVQSLSAAERRELFACLSEQAATELDPWEQQMARDFAPQGRATRWLDEIDRQIEAGEFRSANEVCRE